MILIRCYIIFYADIIKVNIIKITGNIVYFKSSINRPFTSPIIILLIIINKDIITNRRVALITSIIVIISKIVLK